MTFDQKKLALMLAWVVTVLLCGAIVSVQRRGMGRRGGAGPGPGGSGLPSLRDTPQTQPHKTNRARR